MRRYRLRRKRRFANPDQRFPNLKAAELRPEAALLLPPAAD
jgi:hypothetical protein